MAETETPIYIEPLVGWRSWSIDSGPKAPRRSRDPWAVTSVLRDQPALGEPDGHVELVTGGETKWPQRERLVAACRGGRDHRAPDPACRCGIYAAVTHQILRGRGYAAGPEDQRAPDVVGELFLWGRVIETAEILRAEFAYPKRLFVPHRSWKWAKPLKELYGVPVILKNPFTMSTDNPDKGGPDGP